MKDMTILLFEEFKKVINESSLSRIWQLMEEGINFAIISASKEYHTTKENEERYNELEELVRTLGYGYIELEGGYFVRSNNTTVTEKSLLIPNMTFEDALKTGNYFEQETVLYKNDEDFAYYASIDYTDFSTNVRYEVGDKVMSFNYKAYANNFSFSFDETDPDDVYFSKLVKGSHRNRKFKFIPKPLFNSKNIKEDE